MVYQTDAKMPKSAQKYGCAFVSLAFYREMAGGKKWTSEELASAWQGAILKGLISGDLNHDGDMDEANEAIIQDWGQLARYLGCPLQYVGKVEQDDPRIGTKGYYAISAWTNPANGFIHFVVGQHKPVIFDPIFPGSVTVRVGHPMDLTPDGRGGVRLFSIV
jgi:hypothetical protein